MLHIRKEYEHGVGHIDALPGMGYRVSFYGRGRVQQEEAVTLEGARYQLRRLAGIVAEGR